jgi:hypothetical protein
MGKQVLQIIVLAAGVYIAWWLVSSLVLPLFGVALGLFWLLLKIGIAALLIYWAWQIFKKWNGGGESRTTL